MERKARHSQPNIYVDTPMGSPWRTPDNDYEAREIQLWRKIHASTKAANKQRAMSRMIMQCYWAFDHNQYIIFGTLTYNKILPPQDRHITNYITRIYRAVNKACGEPRSRRNTREHMDYYLIGERPEGGGEFHHHILITADDLPHELSRFTTDPENPERHELPGWKRLWPLGHSMHEPSRAGHADKWARNWSDWPLEYANTDAGRALIAQALPKHPVTGAAHYLSKYLASGEPVEGPWGEKWPARASQYAGRRQIHHLVRQSETVRKLAIEQPYPTAKALDANPKELQLEALRADQRTHTDHEFRQYVAKPSKIQMSDIWRQFKKHKRIKNHKYQHQYDWTIADNAAKLSRQINAEAHQHTLRIRNAVLPELRKHQPLTYNWITRPAH